MPDMDGCHAGRTRSARSRPHSCRWCCCSSLGRREAARQAWFAAILAKPVKPGQLFDTLVTLLAQDEARPARAQRGQAEASTRTMATRHPLRILLAEDNLVNQKLALRLLQQLGYRADVAGNGLEALERWNASPTTWC